jgi:RNA polymerase sigma factor (sigma-70 family)
MFVQVPDDAELVAQSLAGNPDAFGQIVSRYQSLICSLAYSATGNLGQSEDLAQETFITAWNHLRHLRKQYKLRAWLYGIARNRINNSLRRGSHEPLRAAEPLEPVDESPSPDPLPRDQAISKEEEAILWRALERIQGIYREPLVLFYREHQSIENVAAALDLSEDAVKQRLSRGRKLVAGEVTAFVEEALQRTTPGKEFTLGVLAALPIVLTSSAKAAQTDHDRQTIRRYYRRLFSIILGFGVLLAVLIIFGKKLMHPHPLVFTSLLASLVGAYVCAASRMGFWANGTFRKLRREKERSSEHAVCSRSVLMPDSSSAIPRCAIGVGLF